MYDNTNEVISNIKTHLESKLGATKLVVDSHHRYVTFNDSEYNFKVDACFIQCRTEDDFSVPIEQRIDDAINGVVFTKGKTYQFTRDEQQKPIPRYIVVEL